MIFSIKYLRKICKSLQSAEFLNLHVTIGFWSDHASSHTFLYIRQARIRRTWVYYIQNRDGSKL